MRVVVRCEFESRSKLYLCNNCYLSTLYVSDVDIYRFCAVVCHISVLDCSFTYINCCVVLDLICAVVLSAAVPHPWPSSAAMKER